MSAFICAGCSDRGEIGGHSGQTPETFEYVTEQCPECIGQTALRLAERGIILWDALEQIAALGDVLNGFDGVVKFSQAKLIAKKALSDAAHHRDHGATT